MAIRLPKFTAITAATTTDEVLGTPLAICYALDQKGRVWWKCGGRDWELSSDGWTPEEKDNFTCHIPPCKGQAFPSGKALVGHYKEAHQKPLNKSTHEIAMERSRRAKD